MGRLNEYFFDTYALHEISQGGSGYSEYAKNVGIVTTQLNLMELYYGYVFRDDPETAEILFQRFRPFCVHLDDSTIKEAMHERAKLKKGVKGSNFSYIDCIGYVIARKMRIKFLTGDREFECMENVEFVK